MLAANIHSVNIKAVSKLDVEDLDVLPLNLAIFFLK
jgi:hypothetical protein